MTSQAGGEYLQKLDQTIADEIARSEEANVRASDDKCKAILQAGLGRKSANLHNL